MFKSGLDSDGEHRHAGRFMISGSEIQGEIRFDCPKVSLHLHDKDPFDARTLPDEFVAGTLQDLTKVSLFDCLPSSTGHTSGGRGVYYFADVLPQFILYGDRHITPVERIITEIAFAIDDGNILFRDFHDFGHLVDARPFIGQIVHANNPNKEVKIGPNPHILYFTGRHEIFSVEAVIGRIFGTHNLRFESASPGGIGFNSTILVNLAFRKEVRFGEAFEYASDLLLYLGLLAGRPQKFSKLRIRLRDDSGFPVFLNVKITMSSHVNSAHAGEKPHSGDILLSPVTNEDEFSQVTVSWLEKQPEWKDARMRFFNSFQEQIFYTIDRLIASANMFDILPKSAIPTQIELTEKMKIARDAARKDFRALPKSPERDSILGALGRIKKPNLKQKVRHRLKQLRQVLPNIFPDLELVCDEAVNCRNHYVHGGPSRFDYSNNFATVVFFTETLEFVFAASDLIESGWNIQKWIDKQPQYSHPFGRYRINYFHQLQSLKSCLLG